MKKLNVSVVSYLNAKPFIYGLRESKISREINLSYDIPAEGYNKFLKGEQDLALVPTAILPKLKSYEIASDFCIASEGAVASVCVFSGRPLNKVDFIYLDYQSRTSINMLRILLKEYVKADPILLQGIPGYENLISGDSAGLIIGDRAIDRKGKYPFEYDLGTLWQKYSNLPFVYAVWVSREKLPAKFLKKFNDALKFGVKNVARIAKKENENYKFDIVRYFSENIHYRLDNEKQKGLDFFLEKIKGLD